jgi:glycosyltransferase involved in cell wall biosynthesis
MAELKKVIHVMRRVVPEKWGGTESVVFNLARAFGRQGVESSVFCTDMFSKAGPDCCDQVPVRRFSYLFPWLGLSQEAKQKLRLKGGSPLSLPLFFSLLREKGVSLIHTHVQHRLGGMARTAARLKGIPYVVSIHGGILSLPKDQVEKMTEPFRGRFEWGKVFGWLFGSRRVLDDADAIICVGENEYVEMKRTYSPDKVFLLPNGVDVTRFSQADGSTFRSAYGYSLEEKILLCVSRIDYQKNQLGLVRAFASFFKNHPDHRLVLIGAVTVDEYHVQLQQEIEQLGLEQVVRIIPGMRPDDPLLPAAYKAAQFFVLASSHEPFGIVVLEAWAAGTPVLAYAVGGVPGFCSDRDDTLLVEADNERKLAEGMAELAGDSEWRTALAERAFKKVSQRYDWSMIAQQLRDIYRRILHD